jgi:hypothetical protein
LKNNNNPNNFLPSIEQVKIDLHQHLKEIANVLQTSRWLVLLGDPDYAFINLLLALAMIALFQFTDTLEVSIKKILKHRLNMKIPALGRND